MRIGILTRTLIDGDAVGNDVQGQYASLKKHGHDPVMYAEYARIPLSVNPLSSLANGRLDALIYHHSIGWDVGVKAYVDAKCRKVMKWHNITPPHFFEDDPRLQTLCVDGWNQLPTVLDHTDELWADSEFNGAEAQKAKEMPFKIIPPYNQADILMRVESDSKSVEKFNDWNINILMVGRIAQNKDNITAIEGFAKYYAKNNACRLFIVGDVGSDPYGFKVKQKIIDLGLPNVVVTGKVPLATLKALYMISDVLLLTSKHEGFCVPMVEAMALGIPVVSNNECALPYTGQDAVHYATNPDEIVTGIEYVIENKMDFIEKGRRLFKNKYQNSSIESFLLSAVNSIQAK